MHLHALQKCNKPWLMCQSSNWRVASSNPGTGHGVGCPERVLNPIAPWVQVKCCPQRVCSLSVYGWVKCRGHIHYYQIFVCANISMWQWHMYRFERTKSIRLPNLLAQTSQCWEQDVLIWFLTKHKLSPSNMLPYDLYIICWILWFCFALLCLYFALILKHLHMFSYGKLSHCDRFEPHSVQGWSWTAL